MAKYHRITGLILISASLSACLSDGGYVNPNAASYSDEGTILYSYPQPYDGRSLDASGSASMDAPESYHLGYDHRPVSHEDSDRNWLAKQSPSSYTIQVADGDKAAQVASVLYKAPKSDHAAELKYNQNGQAHYKGLYGSYPSREAAEDALSKLPAEMKGQATVKDFGSLQSLSQP